jgi:hypothetical protein
LRRKPPLEHDRVNQAIRLAGVILLLIGQLLGPVTATAGELNHAGLVIRHGDGRIVYAYIAFAEEEISGFDLLERSGLSLVSTGFGALGQGVCTLDGEGCGGGDCRVRLCQKSGENSPFWKYFRQAEDGSGWQAQLRGASGSKVRDGDVDAWEWTAGDAALPALTIEQVAAEAGADVSSMGGSDAVPTPAVKTFYPAGTAPPGEDDQSRITYFAAAAVLIAIGGAAVYAVRRARRIERTT